jgi:hypothetical protein
MTKNAVAVKNETLPVEAFDFDEFGGNDGFGDTNASDFVIPRIGLIGDLSPQIKRGNAKFIPGAEVGDIIDAALGEVLAKGYEGETIQFLPVKRVKEVIRWKPRNAGGGIVSREPLVVRMDEYAAKHGAVLNDKNEYKLSNGDEVIETWNLFGLDLSRQGMPCFVPFKKSNLRVIKPWFTKRKNQKNPKNGSTLPLLFRTILLGSFKDSGNGNEWSNWTITEGQTLPEIEGWKDIKAGADAFLEILEEGAYVADVAETEEVDNDGAL